jgi:hypothetical protein
VKAVKMATTRAISKARAARAGMAELRRRVSPGAQQGLSQDLSVEKQAESYLWIAARPGNPVRAAELTGRQVRS